MDWQSHHAEDVSGARSTASVGFREEKHLEVWVGWGTELLHCVVVLLKGLMRPSSGIAKSSRGWISQIPTTDSRVLARRGCTLT